MKRIIAFLYTLSMALLLFAQSSQGMKLRQVYNLMENKDTIQAVRLLHQLAESGYAPAQGVLGNCYLCGLGVSYNINEAVKWTKLGAEQNDVYSCIELGTYYFQGLGVEKNLEKAEQLLKIGDKHNIAHAQYLLGLLYEKRKNNKEAESMYLKAAKHNHLDAVFNLTGIYIDQKKWDEVISWLHKGDELGIANSQFMLGCLYLTSDSPLKVDEKKALIYLKKAAQQGDVQAQIMVVELENKLK